MKPGSYVDTSEGFNADDARRHKSSPNTTLEDFSLDLRFKDLNSFKKELVDFLLMVQCKKNVYSKTLCLIALLHA